MNKSMTSIFAGALLPALLLVSQGIQAAAGGVTVFGSGQPASSMGLPASEFRNSLESLPDAERARAVQWLQSIEFTSEDLAYIKLDSQGGIYYADRYVMGKSDATGGVRSAAAGTSALTAAAVLKLHSNPGAPKAIFVDFGGGVISDTAWNRTAEVTAWNAKAYDLDNKPGSFSAAEIADMAEIWRRVAEDFAPFNVDVTTEAPKSMATGTSRIMVTHSMDKDKQSLPEPSSGSVAYMNVSGFSQTDYYLPALVYYNNLASPAAIAAASTHAAGHLFGLSHDSMPVFGAAGQGNVSWSPIMGVGPFSSVTQWSKGDYRGASNPQNDIGILLGSLDRRRDDHDDSRYGNGTALQVDSQGRVTASTPATDPGNQYSVNKGVIETPGDIDVFVFDAATGMLDLAVTPAWLGFDSADTRGANLDVQLTLYNSKGKKLVQQDPLDETAASINMHVDAGRYTLEVTAVGNVYSSYTPYGSLGQYFINGTIPAPDSARRVTVSAR